MEGGHPALLQRAQLPDADILQAIMDRWAEEALVQFSTSSLTVLHDKSPNEGTRASWFAPEMERGPIIQRPTGNCQAMRVATASPLPSAVAGEATDPISA